jgi:hypothetical protein
MKKGFLLFLLTSCLFCSAKFAQGQVKDTGLIKTVLPPIEKFYVGNSLDGAIFSTAMIQHTTNLVGGGTTTNNSSGTLRFTLVVNFGFTFNFNLSRHLGVYTGIDLKNIGFIEKFQDANTIKRRTYNIGAPLGIKIGNMAKKRAYIFLGGGMDIPVNYKEKTFVIRNQKNKNNYWLSDRTPAFMPYLFAGFAINRGATFKVQYYPNNFLNPDFVSGGAKPYAGMDVHLILLSLGVNLRYGKHPDFVGKHVSELKTM